MVITFLAQVVLTLRSVFFQRLLRANHGIIQNICCHKEESDNCLMPRRNNDITIYFGLYATAMQQRGDVSL
jgi:hypothetical protein